VQRDIFSNHTYNTAVIVVLIIAFFAVFFLPTSIWNDEDSLRDESRFRMNAITQAERLNYMLTENFTSDVNKLFATLSRVRDSVEKAESDTNYTYLGLKKLGFENQTININVTDEFLKMYNDYHLRIFERTKPSHYFNDEETNRFVELAFSKVSDTFIGNQTIEFDSASYQVSIPEKFEILYQNINFQLFNVLTKSVTKDSSFANSLVRAVIDTLRKNPTLKETISFSNLWTAAVPIDYSVRANFSENFENSKAPLKKNFKINAIDSINFGKELWNIALDTFLTYQDIPEGFNIIFVDSLGDSSNVPVKIDYEGMMASVDKRRNVLYQNISGGFNEPAPTIAKRMIAMVLDSLDNPAFSGEGTIQMDLTDVEFSIRLDPVIIKNKNKFYLNICTDYLQPRLSTVDNYAASFEAVEHIADSLMKKNDYYGSQVVKTVEDIFHINIYKSFFRDYDNMNIAAIQMLTQNYSNNFMHNYTVLQKLQDSLSIDTIDFNGEKTIYLAGDTLSILVKPDYAAVYDSMFVVYRDTVIKIQDTTFFGVWDRGSITTTTIPDSLMLPFLVQSDSGQIYKYDFADSTLEIDVPDFGADKVERAFFKGDLYLVGFNKDSLVYDAQIILNDELFVEDSSQLHEYSVVSPQFVSGTLTKKSLMAKDSFYAWIDTSVAPKFTKITLGTYYTPTNEWQFCPVSKRPFRVTIRNNVNLTVESPLDHPIETSRYLFFTQIDTFHGQIVDGEMSWVK
jgi:hypothetical protein